MYMYICTKALHMLQYKLNNRCYGPCFMWLSKINCKLTKFCGGIFFFKSNYIIIMYRPC